MQQQQQFFGDFSATVLPGKPSHAHHPGKLNQFDSDQSLLEMLNSTVACLKQKNMDLEALGCLEQSLWLKRRMFGVDNSVVQRALNEVVLSYNSVAMQYLAQAQFDQCLAMLRKAEAITAPGNFRKCQSLQILTFNNIGCCYRKLGKLKSALKYLKEAAQIGSTCAHVKNLSITHLNLCAIQSQLGRHDLALEHAQAAIFHTQEELVGIEAALNSSRRGEDDEYDDGSASSSADVLDAKSREEKIISLAVAYHNLAVELEFNGRGEASLQWYKKALQLVWKYRESNAALCASFKKIFTDAKNNADISDLEEGDDDDDDCDVLDDDEPSETEETDAEMSDGFADLLLRRDRGARTVDKQGGSPTTTSSSNSRSDSVQAITEVFIEIVDSSNGALYATEHELRVTEHELKQLRKEEIARQVRSAKVASKKGSIASVAEDADEDEEEAALQLAEVESVAATAIQKQFRKREPLERAPNVHRRNSAAVRIQAALKGHMTREIVTEHCAAQLSRMYVERKHAEIALGQALAMEMAFLEELAATKIQALARGHQSRLLANAVRVGESTAAAKIQSCFRSHCRHYSRYREAGVRSVAVRTLQRSFRSHLRHQRSAHAAAISEELSEVQHIAAASVQRFWRQTAARYRQELVLEEIEAATCIQALGRGHLARKSVQSLRESPAQAVGLAKPLSAFSIAAGEGDVPDYDNDEMAPDEPPGRAASANTSFLPAAVREMYLAFATSPSCIAAREQREANADADREALEDMGLTFDDLLLELETCDDVSTACFAFNAMRVLVALEAESYRTLPCAVRIARVIDQRIQERDGIWSSDMQHAALGLLDAFRDVLLRPA
ncbi:hypothetical protein PybrP1_008702 [[Pythium] brassicae (nom. inval.)]|nr:hypothetical protein PybrP1_008702 [[Pythium] brassicae (nom. inval.)]